MALFQKLENHFRKFVRLGLGKKEVALSMYLSVNVKLEPSQLPEGRYHISSPRGPYTQIEGRTPKLSVAACRSRGLCCFIKVRGDSQLQYGF